MIASMSGEDVDSQGGRPLPEWLHDETSEATENLSSTQPALDKVLRENNIKIGSTREATTEVLSLILAKLQEQSLRIDDMSATLSKTMSYCTCFDVLTMMNVMVDAVCEEIMSHVRSSVEYTDLIATVTISFVTGEVSILLEEENTDIDFLGVKFMSNCVSGCHLLVDLNICSLVIDLDTDKITDVTQLTLTARSEEATRELYHALLTLCERSSGKTGLHPPTLPPQCTVKVIPTNAANSVSSFSSVINREIRAPPTPNANTNTNSITSLKSIPRQNSSRSEAHQHVVNTPTMRRGKVMAYTPGNSTNDEILNTHLGNWRHSKALQPALHRFHMQNNKGKN